MTEYEGSVDKAFLPPECLWQALEPLLPWGKAKPKGGRPPQSNRKMFFAMFYVLKTGCQWKALPRALGCASTVHDRFQQWAKAGVFAQLWSLGLLQCHVEGRLDFTWQSMDGCMTKSPLGGSATGANPTDRGKQGTKRHVLTESQGLPIGLVVTGANRHDKTQVQNLWETMPFMPPAPTEEAPSTFARTGPTTRRTSTCSSNRSATKSTSWHAERKKPNSKPPVSGPDAGCANEHIVG